MDGKELVVEESTQELVEGLSPKLKRCPRCGEEKGREEFHRDKSDLNGIGTYCKTCSSIRKKEIRLHLFTSKVHGKSPPGMEYCPRCREEKKREEFRKNKVASNGLQTYCNSCDKIKRREYYLKNYKPKSTPRIVKDGMRYCPGCKEERAKNEFGKSNRKKDGLRTYCKECSKDQAKKYYLHNCELNKLLGLQGGMKRCSMCKQEKERSEFYCQKGKRDGLDSYCRSCSVTYYHDNRDKLSEDRRILRAKNKEEISIRRKEYYKTNNVVREHILDYQKKYNEIRHFKRYGSSSSLFNQMLLEQENRCAICGLSFDPSVWKTQPFIDHNHANQEIRGLLCPMCNSGLGLLDDSPTLFLNAAQYLIDPRKRIDSIESKSEYVDIEIPCSKYQKKRYGITDSIFKNMLFSQKYCCAICETL